MTKRNLVPLPPKGSIAYDRLMQAASPAPAKRRRRDYDDEDDYYDVYDDRRAWSRVPYPYQFKWDAGWIFVTSLAAFGGLSLWLLPPTFLTVACLFVAGVIALLRCVLWCCFRFPFTSWFFVILTAGLIGGRRGRRW